MLTYTPHTTSEYERAFYHSPHAQGLDALRTTIIKAHKDLIYLPDAGFPFLVLIPEQNWDVHKLETVHAYKNSAYVRRMPLFDDHLSLGAAGLQQIDGSGRRRDTSVEVSRLISSHLPPKIERKKILQGKKHFQLYQ